MQVEAEGVTIERDGAAVRGVLPAVRYRSGGRERTFLPSTLERAPGGAGRATDGAVSLALDAEQHGPTCTLVATVRNLTGAPIELVSLSPLRASGPGAVTLAGGPASWSWYRNGWGSFSTARAMPVLDRDRDPWLPFVRRTTVDPAMPRSGRAGHLRSQLVGALSDRDSGATVVLGFVGSARAFGAVDLHVDDDGVRSLEATCGFDGAVVGPGGEVASEPLQVSLGDDGVALLESWAAELGHRMDARVPAPPPAGWCSWYYYFHRVAEPDVRENLGALEHLDERVRLDYVMVDDGHQRRVGDWLQTHDRFPSGMAALAGEIVASGRDAGIWLAPFIADPSSDLLRDHPDWALRDERARPVKALWNPIWNRWRSMVALDTTRPDVQVWLHGLAHHVRHTWGYRVLKLDFSYAAALPGVRHDQAATRAEALRRGLAAIRAGAGPDAFLLGCGMPLGAGVGLVDGMRISTDVAPSWSNPVLRRLTSDEGGITTRGALRNVLTRSFLHGRLWANDPDCVMVRTDRTKLTDAEVRTQAVVAGMTDGMLVSSDRLALVPEERLDLLALAARLAGGDCRVVDLLDRALPELVVSVHDDVVHLAALNLGDEARAVVLEHDALLAHRGATELLDGREVPIVDGRADLGVVEAHGCRVLEVPRNGT